MPKGAPVSNGGYAWKIRLRTQLMVNGSLNSITTYEMCVDCDQAAAESTHVTSGHFLRVSTRLDPMYST